MKTTLFGDGSKPPLIILIILILLAILSLLFPIKALAEGRIVSTGSLAFLRDDTEEIRLYSGDLNYLKSQIASLTEELIFEHGQSGLTH